MTEAEIKLTHSMSAIDYIMIWFKKRISSVRGGVPMVRPTNISDRIICLRSGTGSGKSVTFPRQLYIDFWNSTRRNILVTQPRILTTIQITEKVANIFPELTLGENIGYQTHEYIYKPKKGIIYTTDGILTQILKTTSDERIIEQYSFLIIDECHLRSLETDLSIGLLKQFLLRNCNNIECPFIILTSATFDAERYAEFFGIGAHNIFDVIGVNNPITDHFLQASVSKYAQVAADTAIDIHNNTPTGDVNDILIFVNGMSDINTIKKYLKDKKTEEPFVVIGLNSDIFHKGESDYNNIFKPLPSIKIIKDNKVTFPKRRIIISTNVAETGVTIESLKYLIDTGYETTAIFNPLYGTNCVFKKNITQAAAIQRKGRVGRLSPGEYYPLYTKDTFNAMPEYTYPDIISSDVTTLLLGLIIKTPLTETFDVGSLDLLDQPTTDGIAYSMEKLYTLGFIDAYQKPTAMGIASSHIAIIPLENIRMVFAGYNQKAHIPDLITITAYLIAGRRRVIDTRSKSPFRYDSSIYGKFTIGDDFIEGVFIWNMFSKMVNVMKNTIDIKSITDWCVENGLLYDGLLKMSKIRDNLIEVLIQGVGIDPFYSGLDIDKYDLIDILQNNPRMGMLEICKLKHCIYEGYRLNTATWDTKKGQYILDTSHMPLIVSSKLINPIDHSSFEQKKPQKIIASLVDFKRNFKTGVYELTCDCISILDGYVSVDSTFVDS